MQAADVVTPMRDKVKMLSEEFPGAETRTIRVALSANHGDVPAAAAMLRGQQRQVRQEAVSPGDEEDPATRKRKVAESLTRVRRNFAAMKAEQQGAQVEGAPARQMEPEDLARGDTLRDGSRTPSAWGESDSACSSPSPLKSSPIVSSELRSDDSKKTAAGPGGRARGDHSGVGTEAEPEAEAETIAEAAVEDEAEPGEVLVRESGRAQASSLDAATSTAAATSTEVGAGAAPEPAPEVVAGAGAEVATTSETVAAPASVTEAGAAAEDGAGSEPAGGDDVTLRPAAPWSDKDVDFTEKVAEKKAMTNKEADEEDAAILSEISAAEKAMAEDVAKRRAAGEVPPVGTIPFFPSVNFDNFGQFIRQGLLHPVRRIAPVAVEGYKFRRWSGTVPVYTSVIRTPWMMWSAGNDTAFVSKQLLEWNLLQLSSFGSSCGALGSMLTCYRPKLASRWSWKLLRRRRSANVSGLLAPPQTRPLPPLPLQKMGRRYVTPSRCVSMSHPSYSLPSVGYYPRPLAGGTAETPP